LISDPTGKLLVTIISDAEQKYEKSKIHLLSSAVITYSEIALPVLKTDLLTKGFDWF